MTYTPPFIPCEEAKGKHLGPFWIPEEDLSGEASNTPNGKANDEEASEWSRATGSRSGGSRSGDSVSR